MREREAFEKYGTNDPQERINQIIADLKRDQDQ